MERFQGRACLGVILLLSCGGGAVDSNRGSETSISGGDTESEPSTSLDPLEILPGVGIGPVTLGRTYGDLVSAYGEPDVVIEYNRVFFATWMELGVEVVMGSARDDSLENESMVVSVGTRLPQGFTGIVVPGMTRAQADAALGACLDVVDDAHCYHSAGVYLGYDPEGWIKTVAVHPPYTPRTEPPEMMPALGLGEM